MARLVGSREQEYKHQGDGTSRAHRNPRSYAPVVRHDRATVRTAEDPGIAVVTTAANHPAVSCRRSSGVLLTPLPVRAIPIRNPLQHVACQIQDAFRRLSPRIQPHRGRVAHLAVVVVGMARRWIVVAPRILGSRRTPRCPSPIPPRWAAGISPTGSRPTLQTSSPQ